LTQKTRYQKVTSEYTLEIDVFEENLQGYATADFEFENEHAAKDFVIPDFC
jgi:CYTH domain-containing protein